MNVSFLSLPLETQFQVIILYIDMALVAMGRILSIAIPMIVIAMAVFMFPSRQKRRRKTR